jgi:hypothetical protein
MSESEWKKLRKTQSNFMEEMKEEWDIETDENGDLCFDYHAFWHDFNIIIELVNKVGDVVDGLVEENKQLKYDLAISRDKYGELNETNLELYEENKQLKHREREQKR